MRESSKASLCGVTASLAIVILLSTYLSPFLVYTAPAFAGLLLLIIVNELGVKWGIGTYFTISLLSFFIISDKESAVFFTTFFGYFPILVHITEIKIKNTAARFITKLLIFNFSCILTLLICLYILGLESENLFAEGIAYKSVFIALMNIFFIVYDNLIKKLQTLYEHKFRKHLRKLFNIK